MKALKTTLISLLGLFLLLVIVSFFLPSKVRVERSMVLTAHPHQIMAYIENFRKWDEWSSWHQKDTTAQYTYNEIEKGLGASYSWKSEHPEVGNGEMKIVEVLADTFIKMEMKFEGMGVSYSYFRLTEEEAGTKVTWVMESDGEGMPWYFVVPSKYFNLFMDGMVGKDFELGLGSLQSIMSKLPHYHVGDYEAEIREFGGMFYVGIREKIEGGMITQKMSEHYTSIENELKKQGQEIVGVPFSINHFAKNNVYDITTAMGTGSLLSLGEPFVCKEIPAGKWMVVKYKGGYSGLGSLYQKGFEMLASQNLKPSGAPLEFYLVNPGMEVDSNKWVTELIFPFIE